MKTWSDRCRKFSASRPAKGVTSRIAVVLTVIPAALSMAGPAAAQSGRLEAESGVAALLESAREGWNSNRGVSVGPVGVNGASRSIAKLCRGEIAAAGSGRPMTDSEREACAKAAVAVLELPLARNAMVVVTNPRNTWTKSISVAELRRAWLEGGAKPAATWQHLNPTWPDLPLKLYGPGPTLALYAHYREALAATTSEPRTPLRRDVTASDILSILADGIARDQHSLGVLDSVTYFANAKRIRRIPTWGANDGADLDLGFPVNLIVSATALRDRDLAEFVDHLLLQAARLAPPLGLQPLSEHTYRKAREQLASHVVRAKQ